jgi:hypothetical protein
MQNINANSVAALLASTHGTTFASIVACTPVATAAAHRHLAVLKHTVASVQLFNNVRDYSLFATQAKRSAGATEYVLSDTYFEHTACFSVVKHKQREEFYLYAIYNNASSTYTINGAPASKAQVLDLMTPSARAQAEDTTGQVYNKTNDVMHTITLRTTKLSNIVQITANKQTLAA